MSALSLKQRKTAKCKTHLQPEFVLFYDDNIPEAWMDWLTQYLEESSEKSKYADGQTIQVGWILDRIKAEGDDLTIYEPDFESLPSKWNKSTSTTLSHIFLQRYVADSIGLTNELNFPSIRHSAIRCNQFPQDQPAFYITRCNPREDDPRDSGWFLGCLDSKHDHDNPENFALLSLYEAVMCNKFIVPYLALPVGVNVIEVGNPDGFEIAHGNDVLPPQQGSYLEKWLNDRRNRDTNFQRNSWNS